MTRSEKIREIIRAIPVGEVFNRKDVKTALGTNLSRPELTTISNILSEFTELGMLDKVMRGVYIRNGKRPTKCKAKPVKIPTVSFSEKTRQFVKSIPAGAKYNRQYIYKGLGIKKGEQNKTTTVSKIVRQSIRDGESTQIDSCFRKTGSGDLDLQCLDDQPMIIYRGVISQIDEFLKESGLTESQLKYRIDYGFYKNFTIFKTKDMEEAKYYAKDFCNVGNVDGDIEMDEE